MSQVDNLHVDAVTGLKLGIGAEGTGRNATSVYIGIMFEDTNGNTSQSLTTNLLTLKNNVADPTVTGWNTTYLTQFADKALVKFNKDFPALIRAAAKPRAVNGSLVPGNPKLGVAIANATKKAPSTIHYVLFSRLSLEDLNHLTLCYALGEIAIPKYGN